MTDLIAPGFQAPMAASSVGGRIVAGYIRESAGDTLNDSEREGQRIDVRRLAERDGCDTAAIVWYDDWGRSGSRGADRPAQARLMEEMAAGQIAVIYARAEDRLMRDMRGSLDFEDLARAHGVRIVTEREGEVTAVDLDANFMLRAIPRMLAEAESRLGRVRARTGRVTRLRNIEAHRRSCARGNECEDRLHWDGRPPYGIRPGEDLQAVIDSFEEAGSYQGAARLLNARGVRSQRDCQWESTTVRRIVARAADDGRLTVRLPAVPRRGRRTLATHVFAGLLVCPHDGSTLTASFRTERRGRGVGYFCRVGRQAAVRCPEHGSLVRRNADWSWTCPAGHLLARWSVVSEHPRPWSVPEHAVLEWAKAATANVLGHSQHVMHEDGTDADLAALRDRRQRVVTAFVDGNLQEEDYRSRLIDIDAELGRLANSQRATVTFSLGLDWSLPDRDLNARLREVLHSIVLGAEMRPIAGVWTRQPVTGEEDLDGNSTPDSGAVAVPGGWLLPFGGDRPATR